MPCIPAAAGRSLLFVADVVANISTARRSFLLRRSVSSLCAELLSVLTEINVIIAALRQPTRASRALPREDDLEADTGFHSDSGRLNNLWIIMCKKTAKSSNWHLIFPSFPPLTGLNLNNLDSRAHTLTHTHTHQEISVC